MFDIEAEKKKAMDGNGIAAYKVGCYLFNSEYAGEIKDGQAQAVKWFRTGVENSNSAPCLYKLACCYAFAFGVEQDPDIAAELFDRAFPLLKQQAEAKYTSKKYKCSKVHQRA